MTEQTKASPRYVVLRAAPDLPDGYMPASLDGLWLDLDGIAPPVPRLPVAPGVGHAYATDRFETREDGARAQVYELRAPEHENASRQSLAELAEDQEDPSND